MAAQFTDTLSLINYAIVTVYGLLLSIAFSGGFKTNRQKVLSIGMTLFFIALQSPFRFLMGVEFTKKIYPLLVHMPLVLILVFILKKKVGVAIVSICTAYSCCQFPRWVSMAVLSVTSSPLAAEISYTVSIVPIFIFLYRYFAKFVYTAMTYSARSLFLFGALPIAYYIFDYATTIYTNLLYSGGYVINEALPTVCILFYVGFISLYHAEVQNRSRIEFEKSALSLELRQAETEIAAMKMIQDQNAVFRHDLRHHLNLICAYLESDDVKSAAEYIRQIQADTGKITPIFYTENNIVNAALSYFELKAKEMGAVLKCSANIPSELSIPDTDLCAVLSNALENAITAAAGCDNSSSKEVNAVLTVKKNKLLISVSNPYSGTIESDGETPVNRAKGHGFGVKSIKTIVAHHNGVCSFEWKNNIFLTRIVMSL